MTDTPTKAQAMEALNSLRVFGMGAVPIVEVLRAFIDASPEAGEPVAWRVTWLALGQHECRRSFDDQTPALLYAIELRDSCPGLVERISVDPLYTHPAPHPANGLTAGEVEKHVWHMRFGFECCENCGLVRNDTSDDRPCKGYIKVALRSHHQGGGET